MGLIKSTVVFAIFFILGCSGASVQRIHSQEITDLSGEWNDTDSRLVAEEMIRDVLSRPWLIRYKANYNKTPTAVVGGIKNLTDEHINENTFILDIERELINSGKVDFVASSDFRNQLRQERAEQDIFASPETRKEMGKEIGADVMLFGSINAINDIKHSKEFIKFYQVNLELIEVETNKKLWIGQKKIKKAVSKGRFR